MVEHFERMHPHGGGELFLVFYDFAQVAGGGMVVAPGVGARLVACFIMVMIALWVNIVAPSVLV